MNSDIQTLVDKTTILQVINNNKDLIEFGVENITSRYSNHREEQIDLSILVPHWQNKWSSFGDKWSEERQLYRNLFDTFQLYYFSFKQLKNNKAESIPIDPYDDKLDMLIKFSGANLFGVYSYGKKCIDLIYNLNLTSSLDDDTKIFIKKFRESRNKLFEHNFNPYNLSIKIDPSIWSIASTNSLCDIRVHGTKENEYTVKVDYYDDYYKLEAILSSIIRSF